MNRDLVPIEADQAHVAQPAAILDLADLALQPAADTGPLGGELFREEAVIGGRWPGLFFRSGRILGHARCLPPAKVPASNSGSSWWRPGEISRPGHRGTQQKPTRDSNMKIKQSKSGCVLLHPLLDCHML